MSRQSSSIYKILSVFILLSGSTQICYSQLGTGLKFKTRTPATIRILRDSKKGEVNFTNPKGKQSQVYPTLTVIRYNYLKERRDAMEIQLKTLSDELDLDSRKPSPAFDRTTIESKSNAIASLEAQLSVMQRSLDSLYHEHQKETIRDENFLILPGAHSASAFYDLAYDTKNKQFTALNNAGISLGNKSGSLYSEIASGTIKAFRVSLGTMVSNSQSSDDTEEKNQEAYQRLISYGGNTVLMLEYPFVYAHSNDNQFNLLSRFIAKGTGDLPAFGTNTDSWAGSGSIGIDLYADAATTNGELKFFCNMNINRIFGTEVYKENLGISKADFSFGQITLGLIFLEKFKLSFVVNTFSSEESLRKRKVVAGGQVLR